MNDINNHLKLNGLFPISVITLQSKSEQHPPMDSLAATKRVLGTSTVHFNGWEDMSKDWIKQVVALGGDDFQTFGTLSEATFAVIDEGVKGGHWGKAIYDVGQTLLPVISDISPVLGFGLGIFMSIFGFGSRASPEKKFQDALNDLYKKIIKEVHELIDARSAFEDEELATEKLALAMQGFEYNSAYLSKNLSNQTLTPSRIEFWTARNGNFRNDLALYVFNPDCVNSDVSGPSLPLTETCKTYQTAGVISMQVPFILTHLNILTEIVNLTTVFQRPEIQIEIQNTAGSYYRLLKDSYSNYRKFAPEKVKCDYAYSGNCDGNTRAKCVSDTLLGFGTPGFSQQIAEIYWKCGSCQAYLTSASATDPNSGVNIPSEQQCASRVYMSLPLHFSFPSGLANVFTVDICNNRNFDSNWAGGAKPCTNTNFASYRSSWQQKLQMKYEPILQNLSRISKA